MSDSRNPSLQEAFRYIEQSLRADLEGAKVSHHPTVKGDVVECAWRRVLRRYLPARFSVGSGFVIDSRNQVSQQTDCIIYDNVFTPKFWGEGGHLYIPAEAVHAVFEIKPSVNGRHIQAASEKAMKVRRLHRTSISYMDSGQEAPPKEPFHIIGGLMASSIGYKGGIVGGAFNRAVRRTHRDPRYTSIDMVLTACSGFVDYFESGYPTERSPYGDSDGGAAARGLFRLVQALLSQGTVGAIDLRRYLE